MADLKNSFCWSFSQAKDFAECRRRHYWNRYGFWGGWEAMAPGPARTAYRLKQMKNKWSLIGEAVDTAITELVERSVAGAATDYDKALAKAQKSLRDAWKQHQSEKWRSDPKRCVCIRELYYDEISPEPSTDRDAWVDSVKERTENSLLHFFSHVLPRLEGIRHTDMIPISRVAHGDPEHFHLGQVKVYAIPDCAYRRDDRVVIHDWKTGVRREEHERQISIYGVWAQVKHAAPADTIDLCIEYLQSGETHPVPFDADTGHETSSFILESVNEMRTFLVERDIERNEAKPIEGFEKTDDLRKCRQCNYRELCDRQFVAHIE